jgi:hypothetical protein
MPAHAAAVDAQNMVPIATPLDAGRSAGSDSEPASIISSDEFARAIVVHDAYEAFGGGPACSWHSWRDSLTGRL